MRALPPPSKTITDKWLKIAGEEALSKMYRLAGMGELLDGLAHNLNTPLSAVMARAEMLRDRLLGLKGENLKGLAEERVISQVDKCIRDAEVIVTNALKLSDNIKNMMNKRIRENDDAPQMLNLNDLIREELQFMEADMKFKHEITKTCALDDSLPAVKGIYHHFSQIIIQIIRTIMESLDASDRKELSITTRVDDTFVFIEFRDTGIVPAEGDRPRSAARLERVAELLKPYGAEFKVVPLPHDNLHIIKIPATASAGAR